MPRDGAYSATDELAQVERINPSYLARVLRLTLLAPDIVESILDGRHDPEQITLKRLMKPVPGRMAVSVAIYLPSAFLTAGIVSAARARLRAGRGATFAKPPEARLGPPPHPPRQG